MTHPTDFQVEIPTVDTISQGKEVFLVRHNGRQETILAHDYDKIYSIPGLYEHLFYDNFKCCSPQVVCSALQSQLVQTQTDPAELRVLDLGAGNGMMGEELQKIGAQSIVGIDIIEEAASAVYRDRPEVYDDYVVGDITDLPKDTLQDFADRNFNCLTIVAALGFDDIPPPAFGAAYNLVELSGWIAFNIKDEFVREEDCTGFARLIHRMNTENIIKLHTQQYYCHRYCQDGTPLNYFAIVGQKNKDIPDHLLQECA